MCITNENSVNIPTFEDVIKEQGSFIRRTLSQLRVHANDLDDVAQAVFMGIHRGLSAFDPSLASEPEQALRAWIFGICEKQGANWRRRAIRRAEVLTDTEDLDEQQGDTLDPEENCLRLERQAAVRGLLNETTPDRRGVLLAYDLEDMEMSETARALGICVNTAWNRRRGGLLDLRAAWQRTACRGKVPVGSRTLTTTALPEVPQAAKRKAKASK